MEDKFDKILADKIRKSVENQHFDYNPDHWQMLLDKKKGKKKRAIWYWRGASILVIGLLVSLFLKDLGTNGQLPEEIEEKVTNSSENDSILTNPLIKNENTELTNTEPSESIEESTTDTLKGSKHKSLSNQVRSEDRIAKVTEAESKNTILENSEEPVDSLITSDQINSEILKNPSIEEKITEIDSLSELELQDKLKKANDLMTFKESDSVAIIDKRKMRLALNAAPIFNYDAGVDYSNMGFTGGITVDIPISKRFDLQTGISYVNQEYDFSRNENDLGDVISAKGSPILLERKVSKNKMEIPLNVKYNFTFAEKDVFVSVGLINALYSGEKSAENFLVNSSYISQESTVDGTAVVKYKLQKEYLNTSQSHDQGMNISNYLKVSAGMKVPLNKKGEYLVLEPFYRHIMKQVSKELNDYSLTGIYIHYYFNF